MSILSPLVITDLLPLILPFILKNISFIYWCKGNAHCSVNDRFKATLYSK